MSGLTVHNEGDLACLHRNATHISLDMFPPILTMNCPDCGRSTSYQDTYENAMAAFGRGQDPYVPPVPRP